MKSKYINMKNNNDYTKIKDAAKSIKEGKLSFFICKLGLIFIDIEHKKNYDYIMIGGIRNEFIITNIKE